MKKMTEDNHNPLRCFFAFEGYNSQGLALDRLKRNYPEFDWVCVGRSEIGPNAIKAAMYGLAGDSIVISCLYHIFRTMFISGQPENNKDKMATKQYTIFDYL